MDVTNSCIVFIMYTEWDAGNVLFYPIYGLWGRILFCVPILLKNWYIGSMKWYSCSIPCMYIHVFVYLYILRIWFCWYNMDINIDTYHTVCVMRERERECVCVCVYVRACARAKRKRSRAPVQALHVARRYRFARTDRRDDAYGARRFMCIASHTMRKNLTRAYYLSLSLSLSLGYRPDIDLTISRVDPRRESKIILSYVIVDSFAIRTLSHDNSLSPV